MPSGNRMPGTDALPRHDDSAVRVTHPCHTQQQQDRRTTAAQPTLRLPDFSGNDGELLPQSRRASMSPFCRAKAVSFARESTSSFW